MAQARSWGVNVRYRMSGRIDDLPQPVADVLYRAVQEALINAVKHAPGAGIDVSLDDRIEARVVNGPAQAEQSGLEDAGGGHGLTGMRQRVANCGGTFDTGPHDGGGWQDVVRIPRRSTRAPLAA